MRVGIDHREHESYVQKEVIMDAANQEIPRLERFLSALGTIAHIAPLLGLLGTVTGNIEAFGVLGRFGSVGDPSILAKGISEALITTAAGIILAVPTIVFYNFLVSKVNHTIVHLENRVNELVLLLGNGKGKRV
jgi:biopolymer transport protein ExbB